MRVERTGREAFFPPRDRAFRPLLIEALTIQVYMSLEVTETKTKYAVYTCKHSRGRGKRTVLSFTLSRRSAWATETDKRGGSFRIVLQAGCRASGIRRLPGLSA